MIMAEKYIYFVRHGETVGNVEQFSQDMLTELTDRGHQQALTVAERCAALPIEVVITSDMKRAIDTGAPIAKAAGLTPSTAGLFREWMTPKSVRGKKYEDPAYQDYLAELKEHFEDPDWRYEDAENFNDLKERSLAAAAYLEEQAAKHVLVVTHGKFLRYFTTLLLHNKEASPAVLATMMNAMILTNTGITVFRVEKGKWTLVTWNDHQHFAE